MKDTTRSLIEIHIAVVLFGLSGLFARYVGQPAVIIALGRVFFASISMYLLFRYRGTKIGLDQKVIILPPAAAGLMLAVH